MCKMYTTLTSRGPSKLISVSSLVNGSTTAAYPLPPPPPPPSIRLLFPPKCWCCCCCCWISDIGRCCCCCDWYCCWCCCCRSTRCCRSRCFESRMSKLSRDAANLSRDPFVSFASASRSLEPWSLCDLLDAFASSPTWSRLDTDDAPLIGFTSALPPAATDADVAACCCCLELDGPEGPLRNNDFSFIMLTD